MKLWGSALLGAAGGWAIKLAIGERDPLTEAIAVLVPYGLIYFAAAYLFRVQECESVFRRLRRFR